MGDKKIHIAVAGRRGVVEAPADRTLYVGQLPGSDIRVPSNPDFEDVMIARIEPAGNVGGAAPTWRLVRLAPGVPLRVDGVEVNRVVYLHSGAVIQTEGERYRFEVREGALEAPRVYNVRKGMTPAWMALVLLAVLAGVAAVFIVRDNRRENLTSGMRKEIERSVYKLQVDSVRLFSGDNVVGVCRYMSPPVGTAFLTADSMLLTARHCIQPWLNSVGPHELGRLAESDDEAVRMALRAETANQLEGEDVMRLVSYFTLTGEDGETWVMDSGQFAVDTSLDDIVELGTYDEPLYWRSVSMRYTRRDMMLGDVAWSRMDRAGTIPLATGEELHTLLYDRGVRLAFFGYPASDVMGSRLQYQVDELRLPLDTLPELPGRTFLLAHEGMLTPGFSGGPVVVRDGAGYRAVGVISVTDDRNGYRSYSVPVVLESIQDQER